MLYTRCSHIISNALSSYRTISTRIIELSNHYKEPSTLLLLLMLMIATIGMYQMLLLPGTLRHVSLESTDPHPVKSYKHHVCLSDCCATGTIPAHVTTCENCEPQAIVSDGGKQMLTCRLPSALIAAIAWETML